MRSCPHCNKEIQDEAVFCRFCRRDIDPPLWLTSLHKCPFCAEWVERGIDRCPLCGRELSTEEEPFSVDIQGDEHSESLLKRLKPSMEKKPEKADDVLQDEEDVGGTAISEFPQKDLKRPPMPVESEEGLAILHNRRLDSDRDFDPLADLLPSPDKKGPEDDDQEHRTISRDKIIRWALILLGITAVTAIVFVAYQQLDLSSLFAPREGTPISTSAPSIAPTTTGAIATQPQVSPSPEPTMTPEPEGMSCLRWDEISLDSEGEILCVYGVIKRWFQAGEIPYVAIFSEEMGTFEIIDHTQTYPEFKPGTCVMVEGEIENMRNVRPFINAGGMLSICEPGLESTATD